MTNWAKTSPNNVFWECKSYKINIKGVQGVDGSQSPNCLKKNCSTLGDKDGSSLGRLSHNKVVAESLERALRTSMQKGGLVGENKESKPSLQKIRMKLPEKV